MKEISFKQFNIDFFINRLNRLCELRTSFRTNFFVEHFEDAFRRNLKFLRVKNILNLINYSHSQLYRAGNIETSNDFNISVKPLLVEAIAKQTKTGRKIFPLKVLSIIVGGIELP